MPKETYKIISTIYRLLGEYDSRQLREASRQKGLPRALSIALRTLADEADNEQRVLFDPAPPPATFRRGRRRNQSTNGGKQAPSLSPNLPRDIYKQNLSDFLSSRSRFKGKRELIEFSRKVGFDPKVGAKDSRARVEQKILKFALGSESFRKKLDSLVPNDWSKQTSGWLDLILSSK